MLKYVDVRETFAEIPDEITLCISISGCPIHCKGCHSTYLWEDEGKPLDWGALNALIHIHTGITCVCFMGGDQAPSEVNNLAIHIKRSLHLKTAWYSGKDEIDEDIDWQNFDFIKVGHYNEKLGPLTSKTTNQVFWKINYDKSTPLVTWEDWTYKFNNKENENKD